jgi:hypothetical protein
MDEKEGISTLKILNPFSQGMVYILVNRLEGVWMKVLQLFFAWMKRRASQP